MWWLCGNCKSTVYTKKKLNCKRCYQWWPKTDCRAWKDYWRGKEKKVQYLRNDNKSINETFTAIITEVNDANNPEINHYKKTILDLEDEIEHAHDLVESSFEEKVAANKASDGTKKDWTKLLLKKCNNKSC